jgi:hypothetical protein
VTSFALVSLLLAAEPSPQDLPRLFVLKLDAPKAADPELLRVIGDLLVTHVQGTGRYQVTSSAQILDVLNLEQQKQLAGCTEEGCIAEIAGALGAQHVVGGSLSLLGGRQVLTLRLIDARESRLENQVTRDLPEATSGLDDAMKTMTLELVRAAEVVPWYKNPWILGGIGVGAAALGVGAYFLFRPEDAPEGALGSVTLDAN